MGSKMIEWRFGRGWSVPELQQRLRQLEGLPRNFSLSAGNATGGWRRQDLEQVVGRERPGDPAPGGVFQRAKRVLLGYGFSDPRIVTAHFDPSQPVVSRLMLLELRVLGLRFLVGTAVGEVRAESDAQRTLFGYRYDTLDGHLEAGVEWFLLTKDHLSGNVRFRIAACWRPGQFPSWWSQGGFAWLGPRYQTAWHELAFWRMRELVAGKGGLSFPGAGRAVVRPGAIFSSSAYNRQLSASYGSRARAILLAAGLGGVAGMRSLLIPALLSRQLHQDRQLAVGNVLGRLLGSGRARTVLALAATGELAGDKSSHIPSRRALAPLLGRITAGALAGAIISSRRSTVDWAPVLAGAVGAWAGTQLAARLRRGATRRLGGSNVAAGLAEDLAALLLGRALVRRA